MNKIYKVIWSKTRNCYVAVSEMAKNHGKDSVRSERRGLVKGVSALALCLALSVGISSSAWADSYYLPANWWLDQSSGIASNYNIVAIGTNGSRVGAWYSTAVGYNSSIGNYSNYAVAIGANSSVAGGDANNNSASAIAIGNSANSTGEDSISIGHSATTSQADSIALGHGANNLSWQSMAMGPNSSVGSNSNQAIAIGNSSSAIGTANIALGSGSRSEQGDNNLSFGVSAMSGMGGDNIAVGHNAYAGGGAQNQSSTTAIGNNARSEVGGSIAIGNNAHVRYVGWANNGHWENNEWHFDYETKLFATNSIAIGSDSIAEAMDTTTVGRASHALMRNATAYGNNAHANSANSIAIGNKAIAGWNRKVFNQDGTLKDAEADNSAVAIGNRATAINSYTTAVGVSSYVSGTHGVAVGDSNRATGRYSTAIGAGYSYYHIPYGDDFDEPGGPNSENDRQVYDEMGANQAAGDYSTSVGYINRTVGDGSSGFGMRNDVSGKDSLAAGSLNKVGVVDVEIGKPVEEGEMKNGEALVKDEQEDNVTGYAVGSENEIRSFKKVETTEGAGGETGGETGETGGETGGNAGGTTDGNDAGQTGGTTGGETGGETGGDDAGQTGGTTGGETGGETGTVPAVTMRSYAGAYGHKNIVHGENGYAIGNENKINQGADNALAIGIGNVLGVEPAAEEEPGDGEGTEQGGTAGGDDTVVNEAGKYSAVMGNTNVVKGNNTFVIGNNVTTTEEGTVVVGHHAEGNTHIFGKNSVSLGTDAQATIEDSVALGSTSVAKRTINNGGGDTDLTNTGFDVTTGKNYKLKTNDNRATWLSTLGAVSVGGTDTDTDAKIGTAATQTRQITGVAAGTADTDAVNVAQLKLISTHYYSVNVNTGESPDGIDEENGVDSNYGNVGATGKGAMAAGFYTSATGDNSVSTGHRALAASKDSTAYGVQSTAVGKESIAIGHESTSGALVRVTKNGEGTDAIYTTEVITAQKKNDEGIPETYVFRNLKEKADGKTEVVAYNTATGKYYSIKEGTNYGIGELRSDITEEAEEGKKEVNMGGVSMGSYAHSEGDRSLAIGRASGAYGEDSTAMGINSNALGDGGLAIGHGSSTGVMAEVKESTDRANGFWTTEVNRDETGNPKSNGAVGGIAIGSYAHTEGTRALAVGRVASAYGENSTAMGLRSSAYGEGSMAFGHGVVAGKDDKENKYAVQVKELHENPNLVYDLDGKDGKTYHDYDGHEKQIDPNNVIGAVAMGSYAEATGRGSLSVGRYSKAESAYTTAMGIRADAGENSENAIAIGREVAVNATPEKNEDGTVKLDENGNPKTKAYGGANSIAMGTMASVTGQNSIAIGTADMIKDGEVVAPEDRKATSVVGDSSIAIGKADTIEGDSSIAIGTGHVIKGSNSGAFGDPSYINDDNAYAIGNNNSIEEGSANSFVVGNNVTTTAPNTVVFGNHTPKNEHTFGENSVSLGFDAVAQVNDSVALGSYSVASTGLSTGGYNVLTGKSDYTDGTSTWASTYGAVSIGGTSDGKVTTRQITGVAAGTRDTDAVNVAQLKLAAVDLVAGDNVEIVKNTQDGRTVYTIHSLNAIVNEKGKNIMVTSSTPETTDETNGKTTEAPKADAAGTTTTTTGGTAGTGGEVTTTPATGGTATPIASDDPIKPQKENNHTTTYTIDATDTTYTFEKSDPGEPGKGDISTLTITNDLTGDKTEFTDTDTHNGLKGNGPNGDEPYSVVYNDDGVGSVTIKDQDGNEATINNISSGVQKYGGDVGNAITRKSNQQVNVKGGITDTKQLTDKDNIGVVSDGTDTLKVRLAKNIDLGPDGSVTTGDTKMSGDGLTAGDTIVNSDGLKVGDTIVSNAGLTAGDTIVNSDGLKIKGGPTVTKNNVDMGGQPIHGVAAGTADDDAVNVSQLREMNQNINGDITNIRGDINRLDSRIDKVGAGAAALAGLHPLDFDPDEKWHVAAGVGNYRSETAVALGAFYQPTDDVLFNVATTMGNGNNMVSGGVSIRFGQKSHQSRSKKAMAKEIIELREEVAELKALVYDLTGKGGLDPSKTAIFPDTPENHWAYDYVAVLAGNGVLEGYQDGYFKGNRQLTRYEMAAIIYRLMSKGIEVDNRMLQEFAPELARVKVDTLTHYGDGTPHIQRVRIIPQRG